jgi:Flp pilus assembly protein TadB
MSILAGFVCARLSINKIGRDALILIAIGGGLKFAVGLWLDPPLLVAVATVGTVAALGYGVWLGARSQRRKERQQVQT